MFMIFKANHLQLTTVDELNQARDGRSKILRAEEGSIGGRSRARRFAFLILEIK